MATTTYGTEYVQSSDLVSNWPGSSLSVANRIDDVSLKGNGLNDQTGTSYTLVLTDGGKTVTLSNAAAVSVTIPTNASVAFPTGTVIWFTNKGAGLVTIAGAGGVTVNGADLTLSQNQTSHAIKLATDTWVIDKSPTTVGLFKITDTTFTTSSAVNVNNCFSSTYDNYFVIWTLTAASATDTAINFYYRASGTDTTTNYYRSGSVADGATVSIIGASNAQVVQTSTTYPTHTTVVMQVLRPQDAAVTYAHCSCTYLTNAGGGPYWLSQLLRQFTTTQFDGFSLVPVSGTISGTLRVYGYRD